MWQAELVWWAELVRWVERSGSRGRVGVFGREGVVGGAQWVKWVFWPRGCCGRDAVGRVGLAAGNSAVLLIVPTLAK